MPEATMTPEADPIYTDVLPWAIEIDHPTNSDVILQCIPGARLRTAINPHKGVMNRRLGYPVVPVDQAIGLAGFPQTPGMQVHLDVDRCEYKIIDPLYNNEVLLKQVQNFMANKHHMQRIGKLNGAAPITGKLDPHQIKSLCREMWHLVQAKEAKVVQGKMPSLNDIDGLRGHYLLNPGSIVPNTQPRYEKDLPNFVLGLNSQG